MRHQNNDIQIQRALLKEDIADLAELPALIPRFWELPLIQFFKKFIFVQKWKTQKDRQF